MSEGEVYLIWSHEHGRWWGPARRGYVRKVSQAGRYSRVEALNICAKAIPGTAQRMRAYPELPVRLSDIELLSAFHETRYPAMVAGEWE